MSELTLFELGHSRPTDPQTSRDAAASIAPVVNVECARVYDAVRDLGGSATAYEVTVRLRMAGIDRQQNCVVRRLRDLANNGLLRDTGRTRPGATNRQLIVWEVS